MRKVYLIAKREYAAMVRTKAFLISLVLMPLFMIGSIFVQKLLEGRVDLNDRRIVVIDETGKLFDALADLARQRNETEITDRDSGKQTQPRVVLEPGPPPPLTDEQRLALSQRVRDKELFAFVEIGTDVLDDPDAAALKSAVCFYAESITSNRISRWFNRALHQAVHGQRLHDAGLDATLVARTVAPIEVDVLGLYTRGAKGEIRAAGRGSRAAAFWIPMMVMMLMFMSLMMAQTLLQSVLEEKQQRIAEVLLGSANPFQIMMGKLVGNVGVSLTITAVYFLGGFWMLHRYDYASFLPTSIVTWFVVYQVLGVMLFGSVFIAIGSACTELKEAQSLLMPVMILLVMPMMLWFNVLEEPMSRFAMWLSLFPPATPMLMVLRIAATTAIPVWQPLLGIVLVLATTLVCVFAAGRIFRIGILSQGKAPKIGELVRWMVRG